MSRKGNTDIRRAFKIRERQDVVRELLSRKDGRAFLWWILDDGLFEEGEFHRDPLQAAYLQGVKKRAYMVVHLLRDVDMGAYALMLQEAAEARAIAPRTEQDQDEDEGQST